MDKKELVKALDAELKEVGFERKSVTWYQNEADLIKLVNLQKSNYSNLYYVNLSVYLKEIEDKERYPKEEQCHIRTRLDNSMVNITMDYDYLFDLENLGIDEAQYQKEVKQCIHKNIIPQLEAIKSKKGLLKIANKNPAILNMISLKVKSYFSDTVMPVQISIKETNLYR